MPARLTLIDILSRTPAFASVGWTAKSTGEDRVDLSLSQQYDTLTRSDGQSLPSLAEILLHETAARTAVNTEEADSGVDANVARDFKGYRFLKGLSDEVEAKRVALGQQAPGAAGWRAHDRLRVELQRAELS